MSLSRVFCFVSFFKKDFIYLFIFKERGREGEQEGEKHQCVVASHAPPPGDLASNPGMCPDWELKQRPFGSYAGVPLSHTSQGCLVALNITRIPIFYLLQLILLYLILYCMSPSYCSLESQFSVSKTKLITITST